MAIERDRALLLRRTPFGESSLVVQVLTREHGRIHAMAKGAYRKTSAYYCVLDFFDELALEWSATKDRDLATLRRASLSRQRRSVSHDVEGYRTAVEVLELAELAAQPAQRNRELFDLVSGTLDALEAAPEQARALFVVFQLRFLQNLGLAPSLRDCASCGGEAPVLRDGTPGPVERVAFSAGAGGRLCLDCAREARASGRRVGTLPRLLLDDAARIGETGVSAASSLDAEALAEVRRFAERFMDYHLQTRPKSRRAAGPTR